jgi:hypothetical protein
MLAYVVLACLVVPLLLLVGDVLRPARKNAAVPPLRAGAPRPHVTADTSGRRAAYEEAEAPRAPRIAPGDGMVYRGPARAR